jgi:Domain of unknown function (DUF4158)
MTAIDRTAYPRPGARLTRQELTARYDLEDADLAFIRANARGDAGRLTLATLLKTRQDLGCFTMPEEAHPDTVAHLASQLGWPAPPAWPDAAVSSAKSPNEFEQGRHPPCDHCHENSRQ